MTAIELERVTVTLGGRAVVDAVDLWVAEGEWVALIGPNGAGKTTMLRAIAGLVPFAGTIALHGRSTREMQRREIARAVAVVPQDPVDAAVDDGRRVRAARSDAPPGRSRS